MREFFQTIINLSLDVRQRMLDILVPNMPLFYFLGFVISAALLFGIIYFILATGWLTYKYDQWSDMLGVGDVGRRRQLRGWRQILKRLKTEESINWKLAVLEADKIMDEILKMSGYRGDTVHDRFKQVAPEILSNIERVHQAHRVRDRIAREPDFIITKEEAIEVVKVYEQAFKELGLID